MTLYQFIALNEPAKATAGWNGVLMADRNDGQHHYLLYNLGSFFVEVTYVPKANAIIHLRSFTTSKLLEPYLSKISINDINDR